MAPSLEEGDRLLAVRTRRVKPGQLVAVCDPRFPERLIVKRVRSVMPAGIDVRGDNTSATTDSRDFGPVPPALIKGRVVYRYAPAQRSGRL
jgi:nickel-type superoxide dismutase maturation protease